MDVTQSVKIIEEMLEHSKKSLHKYSPYFILWAALLIPCGILEVLLVGEPYRWYCWPIAGIVGGIISIVISSRQGKKKHVSTAADRVTGYTWASFGFCMLFVMIYSTSLKQPPHALILMLAGAATFISGGISKFKPFVFGGISLEIAAILCAFFVEPDHQGFVFSAGMFTGYLIPGVMLRKQEYEQT